LRAMAVRQREAAGGGVAGGGGAGESLYAKLERALKEAYDAVRSGRQGQQEHEVELPELGGLLVKVYTKQHEPKVYAKQYEPKECAAVFEVFKRGHPDPLCKVELYLLNREPSAVYVDCWILRDLASVCARGGGCWLSWEEARAALELAGWAASRLIKLAGIPAKVEKVGLVKAYNTGDGELHVLPCLQVSMNGKSYSVCQWVRLYSDPGGGWEVKSSLRLVPIGEVYAKMVRVLAELRRIVSEYTWNQESEGAERARAREYRGEFLELEEFVLHRPDGTKEVLLELWFPGLYHIGESFAVVDCLFSGKCTKSSDSELADAVKKELEEAWGVVVQAVRRYREEHDPRLTTFAYITLEAVRRAGLVPA